MIRTVSLLDEILNILFPLLNYFKFQIESVSNIKIAIKIDSKLKEDIKNYIKLNNLVENEKLFTVKEYNKKLIITDDVLIEDIEIRYNLFKDLSYMELKKKKMTKMLKIRKRFKYIYENYFN